MPDSTDQSISTDQSSRNPLPEGDSLVTHVTHQAMATNFVVLLPDHQSDQVEKVVEALETLDEIENRLTIHRPNSEISKINRHAADRAVEVSTETFQLIEKAVSWSKRTDGAFDITAGPLIQAWGFNDRSARKPSNQQIEDAKSRVGWQAVELSPDDRTVRFSKPGMSMNLGAIGKGDALDRLKQHLLRAGIDHFLLHGGNSSVIACGDQVEGSGLGWAVGISHPSKPKTRLAGVWLRDMSIATSGSGKQFFHHRGCRYSHVIDPRTGLPAGDLLSLTVLMPSAADADALATGMFVLGSGETANLSKNEWWPPTIAVGSSDRQDDVALHWQGNITWVDE